MNNTDPLIRIGGLNKWYADFHVLKGIDLCVYPGDKVVLCGPSGSRRPGGGRRRVHAGETT